MVQTSLRNGNYRVIGSWYKYLVVDGSKVIIKDAVGTTYDVKIEMGDFGEADPTIVESTGDKVYNMRLNLQYGKLEMTEHGVVGQDGAKITMKGMAGIFSLDWITQEEVDAIEADGDPIDALPCPYKIQPESQGKFLWITGAAGLGKSTSAQMMSRTAGYVYYEADCFTGLKNPYIPPDVQDPSMAVFNQRKLVGEGLNERREAIRKAKATFRKMLSGEDYESDSLKEFYQLMCEDVKKERERIGGDWAIAAVTWKRETRDFIRSCLGPDLVFVVLSMEEEEIKKRILKRHSGDEGALKGLLAVNKACDPAGKDEPNAITIMITDDMTKQDVVNKILETV